MIQFPKPLRHGATIAITAPSSGVPDALWARLDLVIAHFKDRGYRIVEGQCLRSQHKDASAPLEERAAEFIRFLQDPGIDAVLPPWGGELASELLDRIDFEDLGQRPPKWILGYSDISTLLMPLTLVSRWGTAHGPNLMDLSPTQTDPLTTGALSILESDPQVPLKQNASSRYQTQYTDWAVQADAPHRLTEPTQWKRLDGAESPISFRGRLIGGCLDTVAWLAGSPYGDVPSFVAEHRAPGVILYLENVEMPPTQLVRALLSLRRHGWFDHLAGLVFGRSAGPLPASSEGLSYREALRSVVGTLPCPVLCDVDIGHAPPQMTLINGAIATFEYAAGGGAVVLHAPRVG